MCRGLPPGQAHIINALRDFRFVTPAARASFSQARRETEISLSTALPQQSAAITSVSRSRLAGGQLSLIIAGQLVSLTAVSPRSISLFFLASEL